MSSIHSKPPFTYVALITMAIRESDNRGLRLQGIYNYISQKFPYYRQDVKGWKNSIRHNLSLNKCFQKKPAPNSHDGARKGNLWFIHSDYENMFENGNYNRRNKKRSMPCTQKKRRKENSSPIYNKVHSSCSIAPQRPIPTILDSSSKTNLGCFPTSMSDPSAYWHQNSALPSGYEPNHQYLPFMLPSHAAGTTFHEATQGNPSPNVLTSYQLSFYDQYPCSSVPKWTNNTQII